MGFRPYCVVRLKRFAIAHAIFVNLICNTYGGDHYSTLQHIYPIYF